MPKSCSVYNCTNRYSNKDAKLTFHRFPLSKPSVLKLWLENIGRQDFQPKKHMVICSHHFTPDSFSTIGNRKNLLWDAVPTVFTLPSSPGRQRGTPRKQEHKEKSCVLLKYDVELDNNTDAVFVPDTRQQDLGRLDHNYALFSPCETKTRLFRSLDTIRWLHRRLKLKCQEMRRMRRKLHKAHRKLSVLQKTRASVLLHPRRTHSYSVGT